MAVFAAYADTRMCPIDDSEMSAIPLGECQQRCIILRLSWLAIVDVFLLKSMI